jgi:hypothetical protein
MQPQIALARSLFHGVPKRDTVIATLPMVAIGPAIPIIGVVAGRGLASSVNESISPTTRRQAFGPGAVFGQGAISGKIQAYVIVARA